MYVMYHSNKLNKYHSVIVYDFCAIEGMDYSALCTALIV